MAHMIETMAYNKVEVPWHGLGVPVEHDLTPIQMLDKAGLNWKVNLVPATIKLNNEDVYIGKQALVRDSDQKILSVVSDDWKPVQNETAFEFFNEFVSAGEMNMETAGSLCGGELVWALARIDESFDLFKGKDQINSYLLFTNPHRYGWSTSVSMTAIRVVCWNTLNLSLNSTNSDKIVKVNHRREFMAEEVKKILNISREKMKKYKEMSNFLAKKKADKEDVVEYFKRVFPVITAKKESKKDFSKAAKTAFEVLETQPGAEMGAGTWWQPYNAATYYLDHLAGRSEDSRLNSAWYGEGRKKKINALETAVEMANAA